MLFWICVVIAAALLVYAGHRYDKKHRNHMQARSGEKYSNPVDAAALTATRIDHVGPPTGGHSVG